MFLTSRELPLLKELSELCGKRKKKGTNQSDGLTPLISVSMLQRLSKERGEALVFYERQYPYITKLADISQYKFENSKSRSLLKREQEAVAIFDVAEYMENRRKEEG